MTNNKRKNSKNEIFVDSSSIENEDFDELEINEGRVRSGSETHKIKARPLKTT
jgi:hypothetical protein